MPLSAEIPAPVKAMPWRADRITWAARSSSSVEIKAVSAQTREEVVLALGGGHPAANPLVILLAPGPGADHFPDLHEPAVRRDLGAVRLHGGHLAVDERGHIEVRCDPVVGDYHRRLLAVALEAVGHPRPLHRLAKLHQHGAGEGAVVELARLKRITPRKTFEVVRVMKSHHRDPVGVDVIGMKVTADLVVGGDHLRFDPADDCDQPRNRFLFIRLPEDPGLAVTRQPGHTRVLVTEEDELAD